MYFFTHSFNKKTKFSFRRTLFMEALTIPFGNISCMGKKKYVTPFLFVLVVLSFTGSIFPLDLLNENIRKVEAISPVTHSSPTIS